MRASGLTPISLAVVKREHGSPGDEPRVEGQLLTMIESAGWAQEPAVFARRERDGVIVQITPQPNVIVDRHIDAGCQGFAGGRAWFDAVTYRLPDGTTYGGRVPVAFDKHTEVNDYSRTQPDGTPCPPPALD